MCIRDDAVAFDTFGIFSPPQQWAPSYAPRAPRDSCSTAFCGSCDPRGSAKSAWGGDLEGFATRRGWADDGTDMTREVIMAVPTPSRSLQRDHVRVVIITDRPCYRPPCGPGAIAGR